MQVAEENEPPKHKKARERVEQYLVNNGYELLQNHILHNSISFFCEPFSGVKGRFGSRFEYIHSYDIVAKKEFTQYGASKHTLFYVIEIDGWDSRHGQVEGAKNQMVNPKRTILQQQKKDIIAEGVFKICADIIKLCNPKVSIDFDWLRVRADQISKCKTDEDIKKCFIAAASDDYLWNSSEIR